MIDNKQTLHTILIVLMALTIIGIAILCGVPPVSRDALTHHLAVPKLWIINQGMIELPHLPFSYYPMNLDLLYLLSLLMGSDILPKFIHFIFGLLTAFLIYRYLASRLDKIYALTGALFFLTTPVILKLCTTVYVDLGLIFFSFAAMIMFFKWISTGFHPKELIICGSLCGLAVGTKYQGLITLLILSTFTPLMFMRSGGHDLRNQSKAISYGLVFLFSALIISSPWLIRNALWTGNPIHPLFKSHLTPKVSTQSDASLSPQQLTAQDTRNLKSERGWGHFNVRKYVYQESGWEILTIPIRIFFQGQDDQPKYFDGKLNPFLLILPLLAFIGSKKQPSTLQKEKWLLAIFSILYLLFVFLQADMRVRYVSPILPPLTILTMIGLFNLQAWVSGIIQTKGWRIIGFALPLVVLIMFSLNAVYFFKLFRSVDPFPYIFGKQNRYAYIIKHRPEYDVIRYANQNLSNTSRVLAVFLGRRGYYSDREMLFDFSFISKSVNISSDPDRLYRQFKQRKITHLIFRYDLFNQWVNSSVLSDRERGVLKQFLAQHTQRQYAAKGHGLYRLVEAQPNKNQ